MRLNGFHEIDVRVVRQETQECNSYHLTSECRHSILKQCVEMASCERRNPRIVLQGGDCIERRVLYHLLLAR